MSDKKVKCTINGKEIAVEEGATVIQAFKKMDQPIAHYCWHPGLSVAGVCRLCMVEIEGIPKLQIACNTEVKEGMKISSLSDKVKSAVKWGLEFHLINHPLDCPICDQAGECELQEQYMSFGKYSPNMAERKVKKRKVIDLGSKIVLDSERCILCSRCVRFTDEVSKTKELGIFNRGDKSEIGVFKDKPLENDYAINTVDICPVGALTSKKFRFKQRVWYLKTADTVCTGCSTGCNLHADYNEEGVFRVRPRYNQEINGYWMCDKGREVFSLPGRKGRLLKATPPAGEAVSDGEESVREKSASEGSASEAPAGEKNPAAVATAPTGAQTLKSAPASSPAPAPFLGGGVKQFIFNIEEQKDTVQFLKKIKTRFVERNTVPPAPAGMPAPAVPPAPAPRGAEQMWNNIEPQTGKTPAQNCALILTAQYTVEEYEDMVEFFLQHLGTKDAIYYWKNNPQTFNDFDGLLLRGDKNPNTRGLLQVLDQKKALNPWEDLKSRLEQKKLHTLWIAGPENQKLYPDLAEKLKYFEQHVENIIWWTAHPLPIPSKKTWQIPTKTSFEKEGTFVNYKGVRQKIKPVGIFVSAGLSLSEAIAVLKGKELSPPELSFLNPMKTNYFTDRKKVL